MSRTQDSEASSSTAAEKAISTLRARLCSEDPFPYTCPSSEPTKHNDIYKHLRSIFSSASSPPSHAHRDSDTTVLTDNLAESLARSGEEPYKSTVTALKNVHDSIAAEIKSFHATSSSTVSETTALYENVTFPLSATLCHSKNFPKATIGTHLSAIQTKLASAEDELAALNGEWVTCVEEERQIMMDEGVEDIGLVARAEAFGREIDDIVRVKTDDIDKMDKEYRELLWRESNKMMQAMMAG